MVFDRHPLTVATDRTDRHRREIAQPGKQGAAGDRIVLVCLVDKIPLKGVRWLLIAVAAVDLGCDT